MSTPSTSTPWVPIFDTRPKISVPTPVNGKWAYASGGAVVWEDSIVKADDKWHFVGTPGEPAFESGFNNYGGTGVGGFSDVSFRKLNDGSVALMGLVEHAAWPAAWSGPPLFTLPVGYRPPRHNHLLTMCTDALAIAVVYAHGPIWLYWKSPGFFTLDGLKFSLEP